MSEQTVAELQTELYEKTLRLHKLKQNSEKVEVNNYNFKTLTGKVSLKDLFADNDTLLMIHNMGQGCRYCMIWGDELNGFLPHPASGCHNPERHRRFIINPAITTCGHSVYWPVPLEEYGFR